MVYHPFINGNKRTAFTVVESFLELNGYALGGGSDATYELLSEMGAGKISPEQAEDWIARNLAKKSPRAR
jgi:death on curing protein